MCRPEIHIDSTTSDVYFLEKGVPALLDKISSFVRDLPSLLVVTPDFIIEEAVLSIQQCLNRKALGPPLSPSIVPVHSTR